MSHAETLAPATTPLSSAATALAAPPNQTGFALTPPHNAPAAMRVTKRSGASEPVDLNKIVRAVTRCGDGLRDVDPMRVALKTATGPSTGWCRTTGFALPADNTWHHASFPDCGTGCRLHRVGGSRLRLRILRA